MSDPNKFFSVHGNIYVPGNSVDSVRVPQLPTATYTISSSPEMGMFLVRCDDMSLPDKLYGDVEATAKRILNTFHDRPQSTGVLLLGAKGSGKSLLARALCIMSQLPVIVVGSPMHGEAFRKFIAGIDQPTVVLFDEFEKVYDMKEQQQLLPLFDGVYSTKKLFVLTSNDQYHIDEHFINRPGRIYYLKKYNGLDGAFVREYCDDKLDAKYRHHAAEIGMIASKIRDFSFDMLQGIVEEINRYGESPSAVISLVNARPAYNEAGIVYKIEFESDLYEAFQRTITEFQVDWLTDEGSALFLLRDKNGNEYDRETVAFYFSSKNIVWHDPGTGRTVFDYTIDANGRALNETVRLIATRTSVVAKHNGFNQVPPRGTGAAMPRPSRPEGAKAKKLRAEKIMQIEPATAVR
jgi:hypothetical protein